MADLKETKEAPQEDSNAIKSKKPRSQDFCIPARQKSSALKTNQVQADLERICSIQKKREECRKQLQEKEEKDKASLAQETDNTN